MKRSIFLSLTPLVVAPLLALAACDRASEKAVTTPGVESNWTLTPVVHEAVRGPQGLRLSGVTAPGGRVVLRGGDAPAFATGSDQSGRFSLTLPKLTADTVFAVEAQRGEQAAPAPYVLLVASDPVGPVVMIADGAPSQRLDGDGVLDAIDSDGRALLATGRAPAKTSFAVRIGARAVQVIADAEGRWSAVLSPEGAEAVTVTVGERRYDYPGPGSAPGAMAVGTLGVRLEPAGQGRRAVWRPAADAWRSSWFPSR